MKLNFETIGEKAFSGFDIFLIVASSFALIADFFFKIKVADTILAVLSFLGLIPVAISAFRALYKKQLTVDLLAVIALTSSLLSHEWFSAAFITLMLAFARLFDRLTEARAKRIISHLLKYHVENVRIQTGETVKEIHISQVKIGDHVIVESGDKMPVDGIVISGSADVNESSLTGESELVSKKIGDQVFTATVNEGGSLVVKTEKIGADTTLSRIINLIDEASRSKNKAERAADRFTQWYIILTLVAVCVMYLLGLSPRIILSILLVVCADDIAVAIPLAFTAGISHAAKRGVIIKGSAAMEQLSRVKYILTDKTGTLTKGKPKVIDVKAYGSWNVDQIIERFGMGASESRHMVSRAILEYLTEKNIRIHAPHESSEVSGQGITFKHENEDMLLGRLSFMEQKNIHIPENLRHDIDVEKDSGRGISILSVNGQVAGLLSYSDELRPHVKEIIAETKVLGVREWHILSGDNEKAAAAVAREVGIQHYSSNMTPESKVNFVRKFEGERKKGEIVAYIGDGVNDAATLALADVSIAMGGIGSDAAIEAADITIMKDHLGRVPEVMRIAQKVTSIMRGNFVIWAVTNIAGLALVAFGFIGPVGAATYNFLTDFIPIGNALRAMRATKVRK